MNAVLAWLAGTKAGRWLAVALLAAGILWRAYSAGHHAEEARQTRDSLESLRSQSQTDDDIDAMGAAGRRDERAQWVRNDGR